LWEMAHEGGCKS